jgi:hypothetical protein
VPSENPFFKSSYADLPAVLSAVKEPLNNNGITILQPHETETNVVENAVVTNHYVETILLHNESGEFISSRTPIVCAKQNDPQALGSAITYARRYGLQSLVSLPAEDDDGEAAMDRGAKKPVEKKPSGFRKAKVKEESAW